MQNITLDLSLFDTQETIKLRAAQLLKVPSKWVNITLPNDIQWQSGLPYPAQSGMKKFNVVNYQQIIKNAKNFKDVLKVPSNPLDLWEDIIPYYLMNLPKNKDLKFELLEIEPEINGLVTAKEMIDEKKFNYQISSFITEQYEFQTRIKFNEEMKREKNILEAELETISYLDKVYKIPFAKESTFTKDKTTQTLTATLPYSMTLGDLFNKFVPSATIPFATWNGFYKTFIPKISEFGEKESWNVTSHQAIIFKLWNGKDYDDILASINSKDELEWLVTLNLKSSDINLNSDIFLSHFDIPRLKEKSRAELSFGGFLFFPNRGFNKIYLTDYLLSNPVISQRAFIDESIRAIRQKSSLYVYVSQKNNNTDNLFAAHISETNDALKLLNLSGQESETAILFRIHKINSVAQVAYFTAFMNALFNDYQNSLDDISKIYKKIGFEAQILSEPRIISHQKGKTKLKHFVPEMFINGYPKSCVHQPSIVNDNEASKLVKEGKQILRFPKLEDAIAQGIAVSNYYCDHKKDVYPGLRENNLANKAKFPYLPCCYSVDQYQVKNSKLREYLYGEKSTKKHYSSSNLITTKKILNPDANGVLPEQLSNLFFNLFQKHFVRYGISKSPKSFLECMVRIVEGNDIDEMSRAQIDDEITKLEDKIMAQPGIIPQVSRWFDGPRYWLYAARAIKKNIWIWTDENNGTLAHPSAFPIISHEINPEWSFVHIYENHGSESDHAPYPHYELIAETDTTSLRFVFKPSNDVGNYFVYLAKILWRQSKGYQKIETIIEPISKEILKTARGQLVDSFGMARAIVSDTITWFRNPRFPLELEIIEWPDHKEKDYLQEFRIQKKLAREILWNVLWFCSFHNIDPASLDNYFEIKPSHIFNYSSKLPNNTIISNKKIYIPENIIAELKQTVSRMNFKDIPRVIPNYFSNIQDFDAIKFQLVSRIWPPAQSKSMSNILAPPFFRSEFRVIVGDMMWNAYEKSEEEFNSSEGIKIIWTDNGIEQKSYLVGEDEEGETSTWLVQRIDVIKYFLLEPVKIITFKNYY